MMDGIYYKEWSQALGREMEFKVYGTAGVPVLAFPCGGGRRWVPLSLWRCSIWWR